MIFKILIDVLILTVSLPDWTANGILGELSLD
jgi:hypothetical protein